MPRLRLVKVIVQPVFVLDDGEHIGEIEHPPTVIPASEWPAYSGERFPAEVKAWQKQIDAEHAAQNGNRAQRRAAARKPKPADRSSALRELRSLDPLLVGVACG